MYVQSADLCAWSGGGLQVELYKLMMWRVVTYVNEIHCKIWISAEVGSMKSDINSLKACPDMFVKQEIFSPQKLHIWVDLTILWVEVISSIHHSPPLGILFIQSLLSQHTHYQYPQDSAREMNFPHEWEDPERFNLDTHSGITQKPSLWFYWKPTASIPRFQCSWSSTTSTEIILESWSNWILVCAWQVCFGSLPSGIHIMHHVWSIAPTGVCTWWHPQYCQKYTLLSANTCTFIGCFWHSLYQTRLFHTSLYMYTRTFAEYSL